MAGEGLQILSTDLLQQERGLVGEFRDLSKWLRIPLGWHYLLDLPWAARWLSCLGPGAKVLDAGAGRGLMQWWLSGRKLEVISVDRMSRQRLPWYLRLQYPIRGLRADDLLVPWLPGPRGIVRLLRGISVPRSVRAARGTVTIYNQDLDRMPDIPNASVDAVVSISALEHNTSEGLQRSVAELLRVLKPGGRLIATVGAAKSSDCFHESSKGWCYSETTLRRIFDLPGDAPSNFDRYDELMAKLRDSAELRDGLDASYFQGGNNGMPWGKWDPQYQSVGVVKLKPS